MFPLRIECQLCVANVKGFSWLGTPTLAMIRACAGERSLGHKVQGALEQKVLQEIFSRKQLLPGPAR